MMKSTIWTCANTLKLNVAPHMQPGFDYGFDEAVPAGMRRQLCDFMTWVEEHFALPVPLWVDFEYKHYLVSREGGRKGYLFYWSDADTWPDFDDEDAIPMIRLPVRDERWTINEILASFIEGITDYYAWLCKAKLSPDEKEQTVETILGAYQETRRGLQVIDYFQADNQAHWRAAIAENDWRAAKYLARLLEQDSFPQEVGEGTVFLLADGDKLVSFLTLAERDCIDAPEYTPWIGFVHTAPEYRGQRHIGQLIDYACAVACEHGAARVYLCTDHVGLYEKYGFVYLENRVSVYGEDSRIYVREAANE